MRRLSKKSIVAFLIVFAVGLLGWAGRANAELGVLGGTVADIVRPALGFVLEIYVGAVGFFTLRVAQFIIGIAQWNNFVNHPAVIMGWSLVRDVANMILVIVLLFIAMATIFNSESYSYKKLLPRLLVMAVAINFSRTIAGLMIDAGQVFMITFVNAWSGAAGGNFINALKINEVLALNPDNTTLDSAQIIVGYLFGAILITVVLIVLLAFAIILTLRIVTLWMLVVLAPIAFALSAWPSSKAQKQYGQWWDQFVDNIVVGPTVAFFMWLTLATIGSGDIAKQGNGAPLSEPTGETVKVGGQDVTPSGLGVTQIGIFENFASYIIGIGMLVASLHMVQQMRVMGAQSGSKMLNWAAQKGKGLAYKYTGARAVVDRYQAFQRERESARSAKVQEFGARAFGIYGSVQANIGKGLRVANAGDRWQKYASGQRQEAVDKRKQATDLMAQAADAKGRGDLVAEAALTGQANKLEQEAKGAEARASRWQKIGTGAKVAQGVAAAALSPVTGGLSLALLGAPMLGPGLAKSGAEAKAKADQWKDRKVSSHLDALRDEKRDIIEQKAAGVNVADAFEQMAAMVKMAQEGWYSSADIPAKNKQLQDLGADKRIMSRFGAAVERKYEAYKVRDPSGKIDAVKAEKAVIDGTIELNKLRPEDLLEGDGLIPALVARLGTDDQWKNLTATKGSRDATRNGLLAYQAANLNVASGQGLNTAKDAYSDEVQKVAERAATVGADISQNFGFDANGMFSSAQIKSGEASVHANSFAAAMKSKNASKILLSVKANQVTDATGGTTVAGTQILKNLGRTTLSNAAKQALESGDANQIATIKALLKYVTDAAPAIAKISSPDAFQKNVLDLYEYMNEAGSRLGAFK